jgi:hypothetical protein
MSILVRSLIGAAAVLGLLPAQVVGQPFGSQAHHVFPQKFARDFEQLGINVHDPRFGAWWDAVEHGKHSRAYNDAWDEFFQGNPSQQGALDFARKLATDYGYGVNF